jgi:AmiR/NasT family two-component response regulator
VGARRQQQKPLDLPKNIDRGVVLMDVRLQGQSDGVDAALAIHDFVGSKIIFITGSREPATLARIQLDHPSEVLFKPLASNRLQSALRKALSL